MTFDLLTWISIGIIISSRTIYLPSLKLLGQIVLELSVAQGEVDWHDLDIYWVISCTRLRETDISIDRQTDMCKAICPSLLEGGHNKSWLIISFDQSHDQFCMQLIFLTVYTIKKILLNVSEWIWLFNVTFNDISVIYVTAHRCAGGLTYGRAPNAIEIS